MDLLTACRLILAADTYTIFVIASPQDTHAPTYADHAEPLLSAARAAGLRPVHTIVALTNPTGPDTFTYYASPEEHDHWPASRHLNLLVLAVGPA